VLIPIELSKHANHVKVIPFDPRVTASLLQIYSFSVFCDLGAGASVFSDLGAAVGFFVGALVTVLVLLVVFPDLLRVLGF
jgi:hypothetical protein